MRERGEGFAFSPDIQLHFIEIQKYQMLKQQGKISQPPIDPHDSLLNHWVCLFNLNKATQQDIYALSEVPEMVAAFRALKEISQDPHLRQLAAAYDKSRTEEIFLTNDACDRGQAIGFNQGLTLEQVKESMDPANSN